MTLKVYNGDPYFDDYSDDKKFYRVLYRPGVAVQARELTQMQTIINEQVARFGRHMFEEGAMVIPGGTTLDLEYGFIKLEDLAPNSSDVATYLNEFVDTIITGQTSGITARVVNVAASTGTDPITLFVKYTNSGTNNSTKTFAAGEIIASNGTNLRSASIQTGSDKVGFGSAVSVARGVYFVSDMFVLVEDQTIILEKYSVTPTYKIGFAVNQLTVTSQTDSSLNDNANGSPNYAAPGAHRYSITLTLTKRALTDTTASFVQIMQIEQGIVRSKVRSTDYSVIEETLARRTFDESGNYTVKSFNIEVREHLKDGDNRGIYLSSDGGLESKLAVGMESGKAYVRGFEIETLATNYIDVDKSREFASDNNVAVPFNLGAYINITGLYMVYQTQHRSH
jgi:protein involved in ribonucleotide reduction